MPKLLSNSESPLNPIRFISAINSNESFLRALPERDGQKDSPELRRERQKLAIARGALSEAQKRETERGASDLDANLFALIGKLGSFYEGQHTMGRLLNTYGSPHRMRPKEKLAYYKNKEKVIGFNHTLHEIINAAGTKPPFDFSELLSFMTQMHIRGGGQATAQDFNTAAGSRLVGARNEMATEQVLIYGGVDYENGTVDDDGMGGDIIIGNVLIDVKAGELTARRAQEKARQEGHNPKTIIWSHIEFEDFKGGLILPKERNAPVFTALKPDIDAAIDSELQYATA
jgi:hypothetical protein